MIKRNRDELKIQIDDIKEKMNEDRVEMDKKYHEPMKETVEVMKHKIIESKKEVQDVRQNLSIMTKEIEKIKAVMFQIMKKMNIDEQAIQTLPSSSSPGIKYTGKEDILIAGGGNYLVS